MDEIQRLTDQKEKNKPGDIADDELLDAASTALFLGLSERTLERWRRDRTGPSYVRMSVRAIRYRLSELRAWRDARTVICDEQRSA